MVLDSSRRRRRRRPAPPPRGPALRARRRSPSISCCILIISWTTAAASIRRLWYLCRVFSSSSRNDFACGEIPRLPPLESRPRRSCSSSFSRRFSCGWSLKVWRNSSSRIEMSACSMPAALKMSTTPSDSTLSSTRSRTAFSIALGFAARQRLQELLPHPLAEDHLVGMRAAVVEVLHEQKGRSSAAARHRRNSSRRSRPRSGAVDQRVQILEVDAGQPPPPRRSAGRGGRVAGGPHRGTRRRAARLSPRCRAPARPRLRPACTCPSPRAVRRRCRCSRRSARAACRGTPGSRGRWPGSCCARASACRRRACAGTGCPCR